VHTGSDFGNWIGTLDQLLPVLITVAMLPNMLRPFYLISGLLYSSIRKGIQNMGSIADFAKSKVNERESFLSDTQSESAKAAKGRRDILSKLFELSAAKGNQEDFKLPDIQQEGYVSLFAGSDTTAIAMRAVLYQLLTHPEALKKLLAELEDARDSGALSIPVKYAEAIKLPYFAACVKEGMRLHPSVGLQMSRHVPPGGCELAGHYFPAGVRVGANAAVIHYDASVFGPDAASFNPNRWLEPGAANMDVSNNSGRLLDALADRDSDTC
jgi:cytochrome P450